VHSDIAPASEAQEMRLDYQSMGFTLGRHPLSMIRAELNTKRYRASKSLSECHHGQRNPRQLACLD
jgi:error-prone DNA polymerase